MPIIDIKIDHQPDLTSCGPTCLHAIYQYFGDTTSVDGVIQDIDQFDNGGGTIAAVLARDALKKGYLAELYTYNINIFDPSWFNLDMSDIAEHLRHRVTVGGLSMKKAVAIREYIGFLEEGGRLLFRDLTRELLTNELSRGRPLLTGLSATWLYRMERENPYTNEVDPDMGDPVGHFVIIRGITEQGLVEIADPYPANPIGNDHYYTVTFDRLINAILLGLSTYDGNLLVLEKRAS